MFKNVLKNENIEIIKIKTITDSPSSWGGNGIIFYVRNGKGLLSMRYGHYNKDALAALVYNDIPLIKFHADEYFCPTCEKMVSAGYGLNMVKDNIIDKMRQTLNAPFTSLEESFNNLKPIFGLLPSGYYALVDTEVYPSNGNGEFFWRTSNSPVKNSASCPVYGGDGIWGEETPKYILPTQPPTNFNRKQAEFYRNNDNYRAVAYYFEGYLSGLLDGHHKAVASALEKRPLKTLVIIPTTSVTSTNKNIKEHRGGISLNGVFLYEDEMLISLDKVKELFQYERIPSAKIEGYLSMINKEFQEYEWDKDILESEEYFPDPLTLARIEWAGDICDKRLDRIINSEEALSSEDVLNIVTALFSLLSKVKDQEVEDFFVEYLVSYDYCYPESDIKEIVDDYFVI